MLAFDHVKRSEETAITTNPSGNYGLQTLVISLQHYF